MNIEFVPEPAQAISKEKIVINGKEKGYVESRLTNSENNKFVACVFTAEQSTTNNVYGSGATKEAAIDDALTKGMQNAEAVIAAIKGLWREMEGKS